jgi:hypothetical protein
MSEKSWMIVLGIIGIAVAWYGNSLIKQSLGTAAGSGATTVRTTAPPHAATNDPQTFGIVSSSPAEGLPPLPSEGVTGNVIVGQIPGTRIFA